MVAHPASSALSHRGDGATGLPAALLVGALLALFVRSFVVAAAVVPTASMTPALLAGDRVLVDRMIYASPLPPLFSRLLPVRAPLRGDVVWLRSPLDPRVALVKRVVALPGEPFAGAAVPPGRIAVLGDGGGSSLDSRRFGPVPSDALVGRVALVLWSASDGRWRRDRLLEPVR